MQQEWEMWETDPNRNDGAIFAKLEVLTPAKKCEWRGLYDVFFHGFEPLSYRRKMPEELGHVKGLGAR